MGYLSEIVTEIRADIARPDYLASIRRPETGTPRPSLRAAIDAAREEGALLAEFKRTSPGSESPELPARTPSEFVRSTSGAGVTGYSCIATAPRFGGSPHDVAELVAHTELPVLFKDFVVAPAQLDAAVRSGAAAVLLIARLETAGLLPTSLEELADQAHARNLEVLLEFHDKAELTQVGNVAADMYGVNLRDLDTLRMEPTVAEATIRAARHRRPMLGLSGVATPRDARRFWDLGVDGILVGSAVARAEKPVEFLRSIRRPNREADA
jgi:indole-3-glycerol phosphate synthase